MQEQRYSGGGFQNRDSFHSRMNSNMSIDRFTRRSNSPLGLSKVSLIDAMDLEVPEGRGSDLYHNLLNEHRRSSNHNKRSSNVSRNQMFSRISRQSDHMVVEKNQHEHYQYQNDRNSRHSSHKPIHQCNCTQNQCNQEHCSCFLYPNELCIIGLCCPNCIKAKNQFLTKTQVTGPTQTNNINGCLCKNIKCLKLYCRCFREGKKCDPNICKCDGCENIVDGLLEKKKKRIEFQLRKQHYLQQNGNALRQNNHLSTIKQGKQHQIDPISYSFINCACKRSHCLKKYCSCFLHNKPCTQACACEQCQNIYDENDCEEQRRRKQRYARHDDDQDDQQMDESNEGQIGRFLAKYERNYQNDEMNEHMEFEPVNFGDIVGR